MLKVATYNVENLFSRPVLFNWLDHDRAADYLKKINQLSKLMDDKVYAPNKAEIEALYAEVADYIKINIRSSLPKVGRYLFRQGKLVPKGREDWDGFIDLKRERFSPEQVEFTAKVLRETKADIQCLIEVESAETLQMFSTDKLASAFTDRLVIDGNDPRGIDIALATRKNFPILIAKTNIFARHDGKLIFSRDCLEVEIDIGGGDVIHVLVNHFKAKDASPAQSDAKRKIQADYVSQILTTRYDLKKDYVIVAGDFNDEPTSAPLQMLLSTPDLHNVLDVVNHPADDRWTYYYGKLKARNIIDYMLVSEPLKAKVKAAGLERRGMYDIKTLTNGAVESFPGLDNWKLAGSDHALVWAEFDF